jgi:L-lysine exporter family protein LysE/ArgO
MLLVGLLSTSFGRGLSVWFALGFLTASAIKFYGWTMAGRLLAPAFAKPRQRRGFSCASGVLLLTAAVLLAANTHQDL